MIDFTIAARLELYPYHSYQELSKEQRIVANERAVELLRTAAAEGSLRLPKTHADHGSLRAWLSKHPPRTVAALNDRDRRDEKNRKARERYARKRAAA